jgi:hypothetical protein
VTLKGTLKAAKEAHVTCTDNRAANGAVGDVTFGISTSSDMEPLGGQTGYTIVGTAVEWIGATRASSYKSGQAGGDLVVSFQPTTAVESGGMVTITPSASLFAADGATACTAATAAVLTASNAKVTTLAGKAGTTGKADGTGSAASFNQPHSLAVASDGILYVADYSNHVIRKVTPDGAVTTLAGKAEQQGSADGTGTEAMFNGPIGVAVASDGTVYVSDHDNHVIRKITPGGVVTTLAGKAGTKGSADGTGSAATFQRPHEVAVAGDGTLYVPDVESHLIRKITPDGVVTTLAGSAGTAGHSDGTGTAATFKGPSGVAMASDGTLYVSEASNNVIRKVTLSGVVTTLAGKADTEGHSDGTGTSARFKWPYSVAVASDETVYVTDLGNHLIRKVTPDGVVTTLAGHAGTTGSTDGTGVAARFKYPWGVTVASDSTLYVVDFGNNVIRKIVPPGPASVTVTNAISAGASLEVTMGGTLKAAKETHVTCTDNLAANGAVGDVTFGISTSSDTEPLGGQTGYTITPV